MQMMAQMALQEHQAQLGAWQHAENATLDHSHKMEQINAQGEAQANLERVKGRQARKTNAQTHEQTLEVNNQNHQHTLESNWQERLLDAHKMDQEHRLGTRESYNAVRGVVASGGGDPNTVPRMRPATATAAPPMTNFAPYQSPQPAPTGRAVKGKPSVVLHTNGAAPSVRSGVAPMLSRPAQPAAQPAPAPAAPSSSPAATASGRPLNVWVPTRGIRRPGGP